MERMSILDYPEDIYRGHVVRYMMANGFLLPGDKVIDAACGTGYSQELLYNSGEWVGVDKGNFLQFPLLENSSLIEADLNTWKPDFSFDVFISFETIEHIEDYSTLIESGKLANRLMITSVPVIKSTHFNEFHLHDFKPGELVGIIEDSEWQHYQTLYQPSDYVEFYVFKRRDK